jgi:hypothetical protein
MLRQTAKRMIKAFIDRLKPVAGSAETNQFILLQ